MPIMVLDNNTMLWLVDNAHSQKFVMKIRNSTYNVDTIKVDYSEVPVSRPTTRGGVYFTDKMGFKIKAQISGDISTVLSKTMLGPNQDFEEIEFLTTIEQDTGKRDVRIFANLVNYVQRSSGLELNLMVVGAELSG